MRKACNEQSGKRAKKVAGAAADSSAIIPTDEAHDALFQGTARGKNGEGWSKDMQRGACVFTLPGLSHWLSLEMLPTDEGGGEALEILNRLRQLQTTDTVFVMLHLLNLMLRAEPTPENPTTNIIVTLDSVIAAVGLDPRTTAQRQELRAAIWGAIQFGERANVNGERRGTYKGPDGQEIDTRINGAAWRVLKTETPDQKALFGDVPVRVEIAASADWMKLVREKATAQFLPGAAVLAAIPGAQPSGAYAKAIGLTLAGFWRRNAARVTADSLSPTRRELLTRFPPRAAPVEEVLGGKNPQRLIEYWCGALELLAECDFVERSGEVLLTPDQHRARLSRKNWQGEWLDESVDLRPSAAMIGAIESIGPKRIKKRR